MRTKLFILVSLFFLLLTASNAQLIQGTIKHGATVDKIEIWLKPGFSNSTQYLFQIGMPVAFPSSASPQPTGLTVTLDPGFTSAFGTNYSVTVNPVATATGGAEKYFNIVLVRGGTGASDPQTWTSGTEFKVLTATFTYSSGVTTFLSKLADYQDGGSDGQGNFYTQDGNANYYVTSNSIGNFYAPSGISVVGGDASAGYAQFTSVTLPVGLLNFSGYKVGNKNKLQWTTATEINNLGFEIQRSTDGLNYQQVGFINSLALGGNSTSILQYSFDDYAPARPKLFYRLRQLDVNGHSTLSTIIIIQGERPSILAIAGLFPNPVKNQLSIVLNSPGKDDLTLIVMDGNDRWMIKKQITVGEGSNSIPLDLAALPGGSYVLKVVCKQGCENLQSRFVRIR